ncbi:hypothetical protein GCM10011608_35030 [Micromonospora sonchi]|uniref:PqqD family protein n=1 Tax=Micromonospora sonchi TaxID=1763543 RepID=A0A917U215_9ACTN|nr:lasso peptide biosynthesis PqqD family chaperone [Micromonospora sonchi]GGM47284.1 hypothetical protein GCM10011608_35030 [Micromonospora sonchi]
MIRLKQGLSIVEVEDGKVLLDTRRGVYWHLNGTAITMLEELERGRDFDDLMKEIATTVGVDEQQIRNDHLALIEELREAKIVDRIRP